MEERIFDINADNRDILNIIRSNPGIEKTIVAKILDMAFKTVSLRMENLEEKGFIRTEPYLEIIPSKFYMCGISIGGSHCKLSFAKADYCGLEKEEFESIIKKYDVFQQDFWVKKDNKTDYGYRYFETPNNISILITNLRQILQDIIKLYDVSLTENEVPPIISIGIALTGSIDPVQQVIVRSHNLDYLKNVPINALLDPDILYALKQRKIELLIDHNAKATAVCEKFSLYQKNNRNHEFCQRKNIACFYLGSGVGCGLILDNKLIRGSNNFSGELGHIQVPRYFETKENSILEKCTCGSEECLEHLMIHDVFRMTRNEFRKITSVEISNIFSKLKEDNKEEYDKRMRALGYYIGWGMDAVTKLLDIDLVIFSGKMTCFIEDAWPHIKLGNGELNYRTVNCTRILSKYGALAPSIGAAILSTYNPNDIIEWKY